MRRVPNDGGPGFSSLGAGAAEGSGSSIARSSVSADVTIDADVSVDLLVLERRLFLYVRHAPAARRLAYFLTGDAQLAEDMVQDAFVRLAARFAHIRHRDAFDAYLRRTVTNLFLSHLRRLRLERVELARQRSERPAETVLEDGSERDDFRRAVRTLPARQRAAIVLRFYEDLSERETAD